MLFCCDRSPQRTHSHAVCSSAVEERVCAVLPAAHIATRAGSPPFCIAETGQGGWGMASAGFCASCEDGRWWRGHIREPIGSTNVFCVRFSIVVCCCPHKQVFADLAKGSGTSKGSTFDDRQKASAVVSAASFRTFSKLMVGLVCTPISIGGVAPVQPLCIAVLIWAFVFVLVPMISCVPTSLLLCFPLIGTQCVPSTSTLGC